MPPTPVPWIRCMPMADTTGPPLRGCGGASGGGLGVRLAGMEKADVDRWLQAYVVARCTPTIWNNRSLGMTWLSSRVCTGLQWFGGFAEAS